MLKFPETDAQKMPTQVDDSGHLIPRDAAGTGRKSLEKIRKFFDRNTASIKSPELPGTGSFRTGLFDLSIEAIFKREL
jgi:hypothetical protein